MDPYFLQNQGINWKDLLLGSEEWNFLWETALRTSIMFLVILTSLRLLGKRGVKQLSVFELVVIIGLGSAAGDPMFYKDVGILPSLIVFALIIGLYSLVTHLVGMNKKFEDLVEGKPVWLIEDGSFSIDKFKKEVLGQDEFFAELRLRGISHLGQVETAILETNGGVSVYFYEDKEVKFGLPIMPGILKEQRIKITEKDHYACSFCGFATPLEPAAKHACPKCKKLKWVKAWNNKRIT